MRFPQSPRQSPISSRRARSYGRSRAGERWLYGRHAVAAALANPERRWRRLVALAERQAEAQRLLASAAAERRGTTGAALQILDRDALGALLAPGAVHQGLALEVEPLSELALGDLLRQLETVPGRSVIVILDQVTDPQNVGAVLRSAAAFGARAVVIAAHGAPPVTGALAKAASGAVDRLPLIRVANLAQSLARLKEKGFWVCGLDETAPQPLSGIELGARVVLVLGAEGSGLRRLVREHCDHQARLPTVSAQPSLNVSNAAAVALYELARVESG
jgi:23S rRNA (guanosine2251-2'-O)-methyltransferase